VVVDVGLAMKRNGHNQLNGNDVAYVIPFRSLTRSVGIDPTLVPDEVAINREQLYWLIKTLLRGIHIDEQWYRTAHPDVDAAIKEGSYKSAKHHFVENGYFEGRRPGRIVVDETWYLQAYPDIAEGIEYGEIGSCQEHFDNHGEAEGRLPREY
jgi:hypothetical protein